MIQNEEPYITIKLKSDENNLGFHEYYNENRELIYNNIIKMFNGIVETNKEELTMRIEAEFGNISWDSVFTFKKDNIDILKNDVLPFFEKLEEYETCVEIMSIYNTLNKKN